MAFPLTSSTQFNMAMGHILPSNTPINGAATPPISQQPVSMAPSTILSGNSVPMMQAAAAMLPEAGALGPQQIITPDLRNGIIRRFSLKPSSQAILFGMEQLSQSMMIHDPQLATIPRYLFYVLGSVLMLNDALETQLANMPAGNELRSTFDRVLAILDQGEGFVVKECHTRIIRAVANNFMFSKDHLEMDTTARKVMAHLQANKATLNLTEAFANPINQSALSKAVKRTVSSVLSAFRCDLRNSVGARKTPAQSLVAFTKMAHIKYTMGAAEPVRVDKGHIIRFALYRSFLFDRPEMLDGPSLKRLCPQPLSDSDEGADVAHTLTDHEGATVPEPEMPVNAHFWAMLEWWLDCRRIEYSNDMNTPGWKVYIRRILAADAACFPHPETDPSPSASLAFHHAVQWADTMPQEARDENIDPTLTQHSSTPVSSDGFGAMGDFSTFQFVQ